MGARPRRPDAGCARAGFRAIVLSAVWAGRRDGDAALPPLRRAVEAAVANEIAPVLFVYQLSSNTPLDQAAPLGTSRPSRRRSRKSCPTCGR